MSARVVGERPGGLPPSVEDACLQSGTSPPNPPAKRSDQPFRIVLIEHPDPTGERWKRALDLLIEAGSSEDAGS